MRIAIVGAGISGLAAAYFLSRRHEVELFERNDYFGGHSNTVTVPGPGEELHLDTGFVVYNEGAYPRFSKLLRDLDVVAQPSDMSFSVTCKACDLEYSSRGIRGLFASGAKMLHPARARFLLDLWRFFHSRESDDEELANQTLREYLDTNGYSREFERHFLVPLAAAVWSTPPGGIDAFPAAFFLRFLRNHGLLGNGDWQWRTIRGGSRVYVRAIVERLGCSAVCRTPVAGVQRSHSGVSICLANGTRRDFDAAVVACHADEAARILVDASPAEAEALDCFDYTDNHVVLHTDAAMLPAREGARASWNYVTEDCRIGDSLTVTYHLNRLQALDASSDYCVTVNPPDSLRDETMLRDLCYDHPAYTARTLEGQRRIAELNGRDHVFFAGAHLGYGFHEDGVASAARIAALLGVDDA